MNSILQT